jgi:protein of unknwon function (DUF3310)
MEDQKNKTLEKNIEEIIHVRPQNTYADNREKEDLVNHPQHYTGDIECIDVIKQQFGLDGMIKFCLGNAMKYIFRCEHKGTTKMDLQKAVWYLNKAIDNIE